MLSPLRIELGEGSECHVSFEEGQLHIGTQQQKLPRLSWFPRLFCWAMETGGLPPRSARAFELLAAPLPGRHLGPHGDLRGLVGPFHMGVTRPNRSPQSRCRPKGPSVGGRGVGGKPTQVGFRGNTTCMGKVTHGQNRGPGVLINPHLGISVTL